MKIKESAKILLGYAIVILFFSFSLFTALPEPYNLYVMNNFYALLIFIIVASLNLYGLKQIIVNILIYIENKPNTKSVIVRISWKAILSISITALIFVTIPAEKLNEFTTKVYNLALFSLVSFCSIFGISDKLDNLLRNFFNPRSQSENE